MVHIFNVEGEEKMIPDFWQRFWLEIRKQFVAVESVFIKGECITSCQKCPMADVKDNIVNNSFPIVKCRETAKVCYTPTKIPRWCPYAK